jgi:Tat protein translocase TatB subunit
MFGIGAQELILIAIIALVVVGPKKLPITLRAIGRAIAEFRRASNELRKEVGFDQVVDEVTRPLREGMAGIEADVLTPEIQDGTGNEYPLAGPDDYNALPDYAATYPDVAPAYSAREAAALEGTVPRGAELQDDADADGSGIGVAALNDGAPSDANASNTSNASAANAETPAASASAATANPPHASTTASTASAADSAAPSTPTESAPAESASPESATAAKSALVAETAAPDAAANGSGNT